MNVRTRIGVVVGDKAVATIKCSGCTELKTPSEMNHRLWKAHPALQFQHSKLDSGALELQCWTGMSERADLEKRAATAGRFRGIFSPNIPDVSLPPAYPSIAGTGAAVADEGGASASGMALPFTSSPFHSPLGSEVGGHDDRGFCLEFDAAGEGARGYPPHALPDRTGGAMKECTVDGFGDPERDPTPRCNPNSLREPEAAAAGGAGRFCSPCAHLLRAFADLSYPLATPAERDTLVARHGIRSTSVASLLAWRRSLISAALLLLLACALCLTRDALASRDGLRVWDETAALPTDGTAVRQCGFAEGSNLRRCALSLSSYTEHLLEIGLARSLLRVRVVDTTVALVLAGAHHKMWATHSMAYYYGTIVLLFLKCHTV
ncbi:hypothetical protein T492DRAFT_838836 [Pavlovales sp. CCMP2436]|nr:hypothetical protein T492DRAFT_838836 [Pavlovales sp. CCMP2436]